MGVKRYDLDEAQWARIEPLLPGKASGTGRTGSNNRLFENGGALGAAVRCPLAGSPRALRHV